MSKQFTKAEKLATVELKEEYCNLLENVIQDMKNVLEGKQDSKLELELFERKAQLKTCKEIAEDFRKEYEDVFLKEYDARLQECYKNFDEDYKYIKDNLSKLPKENLITVAVIGYEQENPNNQSEELMLLFYERIRPLVLIMKERKK